MDSLHPLVSLPALPPPIPAGAGAAARPVEAIARIPDPRGQGGARQAPYEAEDGAPRGEVDERPRRPVAPAGIFDDGPGARRARGASALFLVQLLGEPRAHREAPFAGHRDAAVLGAEAYRRAGAQPPLYREEPAVFRFTV